MIPIGGELEDAQEIIETSRTYNIDWANGRSQGQIDGLQAIRQVVYKILQTVRFDHLIYNDDYGSELQGLQGRSEGYVRSEIQRRITEALLQDERISAVEDMNTEISGDEALCSFRVVSTFGDFRSEVTASV